jgi:hypothetical protein
MQRRYVSWSSAPLPFEVKLVGTTYPTPVLITTLGYALYFATKIQHTEMHYDKWFMLCTLTVSEKVLPCTQNCNLNA